MSYKRELYFPQINSIEADFSGVDFDFLSSNELKNLWRLTLENGMHGLCFSMYTDGQKPGDVITEEQVRHRINILKPYTSWVRSFSCIEGNEHVPKIAHENGIKTLVGAWLSDDLEMNEKEIESLISLAQSGYVDIAAVGNEVMYRGDLTEDELLGYIDRVKKAIPHINVGYVDAYYEFTDRPRITHACDVVLTNCYPFWEGTSLEDSLRHMQQMFGHATDAGQGKKVMITETGWPSKGESFKGAHPSEEGAMKYFINAQMWAAKENIEMFYFSSFDESWKIGAEGDVGAYWGLWDKEENLKFQ